eukprot:CAMPEP_0203746360 /NCGR_PEP_ID=MMETSP0098-20131031/1833_1 /ASSEMBLY_ACC=CAM_ASM_000208 /TAXON_ID=96639 /ORGANISM=" , Strain NY0313808BC1" /LENGTH=1506 /DNA_ID=CAMNT_0050634435 /DNA_START=86 /DNA_END=4603 /DNA_ORIENTATION=+
MAHKAGQCSMKIQAELHGALLADGVEFSVKIGLAVGNVNIVHVGGEYNRREYVVCGSALLDAFACEEVCAAGDIVVSPLTWGLISHKFKGEPVEGTTRTRLVESTKTIRNVSVKKTTLATAAELVQLQSYVPASVRPYITCQISWLGQLRSISILFINLGISSKEMVEISPEMMDQLHRVFQTVQKETYRVEGSINKFLLDDKGSTILAVLGLPPATHTNDPSRAVYLALDLSAQLKNLHDGYPCYIGITTGTAFCGPVGSGCRREYSVLGDKVNTSARLMQTIKKQAFSEEKQVEMKGIIGHILCDQSTWEYAASESVDLYFVELPPLTLKGKTEPVRAFKPGWVQLPTKIEQTHRRRSSSFGILQQASPTVNVESSHRYMELLYHFDLMLANKAHEPSTVLMIGGAGTSKTEITDRFADALRDEYSGRQLCPAGRTVKIRHPNFTNRFRQSSKGNLFSGNGSDKISVNPPWVIKCRGVSSRAAHSGAYVWAQIMICINHIIDKSSLSSSLSFEESTYLDWLSERFKLIDIPEQNFDTESKEPNALALQICSVLKDVMKTTRAPVVIVIDNGHHMSPLDWKLTRDVSKGFVSQKSTKEAFSGFFMTIATWPLHEPNYAKHFEKPSQFYLELAHSINCILMHPARESRTNLIEEIKKEHMLDNIQNELQNFLGFMVNGEFTTGKTLVQCLLKDGHLKLVADQRGRTLQIDTGATPQLLVSASKYGVLRRHCASLLDKLSPADNVLLKCASVIARGSGPLGYLFHLGALISIYPMKDIYPFTELATSVTHGKDDNSDKIVVTKEVVDLFTEHLEVLESFGIVHRVTARKHRTSSLNAFSYSGYFVPVDILIQDNESGKYSQVPDQCYAFKSVLLRDSVYDSSLFKQRKKMHLLAAQMIKRRLDIEKEQEVYSSCLVASLMNHYFGAKEHEQANEASARYPRELPSAQRGSFYGSGVDLAGELSMELTKRRRSSTLFRVLANTALLKRNSSNCSVTKSRALSFENLAMDDTIKSITATIARIGTTGGAQDGYTRAPSMRQNIAKRMKKVRSQPKGDDNGEDFDKQVTPLHLLRKLFCCFQQGSQEVGSVVPEAAVSMFQRVSSKKKDVHQLGGALRKTAPPGLGRNARPDGTIERYKSLSGQFGDDPAKSIALDKMHTRWNEELFGEGLIQMMQELDVWDFDIFKLERFSRGMPLYTLSKLVFVKYDFYSSFNIQLPQVDVFSKSVEISYPDNPYHNSLHATDVVHSCHVLMKMMETEGCCFSKEEQFSLVISAMVHDICHPGVSAGFLVKTNDKSTLMFEEPRLENFHFASSKGLIEALLMDEPKARRILILGNVQKLVLATALQFHHPFLKQFSAGLEDRDMKTYARHDNASERFTVLELVMKCADVNNCAKDTVLYKQWVVRIVNEFLYEGDLEKSLNLPVSPFMDCFESKMQLGFIKGIAMPLYKMLRDLFPTTSSMYAQVSKNYTFWEMADKAPQDLVFKQDITVEDAPRLTTSPGIKGSTSE